MLYSDKYDGSCSQPRIMATYEKPYGEPEYIHIDDILIEDIEKGNGSILMQYFLKYCKTTSAEYVSGMLSPIDADHFDRSEHYYKKHGFTVVFFDEKNQEVLDMNYGDKKIYYNFDTKTYVLVLGKD